MKLLHKMLLLAFTLSCIISTDVQGQTQFKLAIGGSQSDRALGIAKCDDGGYAIAGHTFSYGAGNADMYVAKFDEEGMLLWSRTFGGIDNDFANSIASTSDGGFIVAGRTYPFGGSSSTFVVKLNSDGVIEWERVLTGIVNGENTSDFAHSVIETNDDGYLVAGEAFSFNSAPPWGKFVYLIKLDANGSFVWSRAYGGPHSGTSVTRSSIGYSVIQTIDGGFAVAGYTAAFGITINNSMYMIKLDANGQYQWSRTIGGGSDDRAYCIIQTRDGGYVLAGESGSFGIGGGYKNMYIVKLDEEGELEWTKSVGGTSPRNDIANSIIQNSNGGYTVAGFSGSFGNNIYIVKLDAEGNLIMSKAIGGSSSDAATSVIQTKDEGYAISGYTSSYGSSPSWPNMLVMKLDKFGETCGNSISPSSTTWTGGILTSPATTVYSIGTNGFAPGSLVSNEGLLTEVCFLTRIEPEINNLPTSFELYQNYPNPFNPVTVISYELPVKSDVKLTVFDILGKEVTVLVSETQNVGTHDVVFEAVGFPSGVYFYKLNAGEFVNVKRMVILK